MDYKMVRPKFVINLAQKTKIVDAWYREYGSTWAISGSLVYLKKVPP